MECQFWFYIVVSFLTGGAFVSLCTTMADRFGSTLGGIIGGFPSTAAVTLFFIGMVDSVEAASHATSIVPLIIGINGLFLVAFYCFARYGFLTGMAAALLVWFSLSMLSWKLGLQRFDVALGCYIVLLCTSFLLFEFVLNVPQYQKRRVVTSPLTMLPRAMGSGAIISLAIALSQWVGPTFGGIFSVFPAVFISTLVISSASNGVAFARSLTKPLMLSGMINVTAYAVAVRYLYPLLDIIWGTVFSILIAMMTTYATYRLAYRLKCNSSTATGKSTIKIGARV